MRAILTVTIPAEVMLEVEKVRKEKDISRSAAVAWLIEQGLKHEGRVQA